jgi:hypothetical protein
MKYIPTKGAFGVCYVKTEYIVSVYRDENGNAYVETLNEEDGERRQFLGTYEELLTAIGVRPSETSDELVPGDKVWLQGVYLGIDGEGDYRVAAPLCDGENTSTLYFSDPSEIKRGER